jgi:hypothetical protein
LWELARGKRVLELGRFHGRSTVALAQTARAVVSVDVLDPTPAAGWLGRFGLADRVTLRRGTFAEVVPPLGPFELIFVDGEHDATNVRADLELALSALAPGGVLACHDYPDPSWPDVRRVVDEMAAERGLVRLRQSDYLAAFRLSRTAPVRVERARPDPATPSDSVPVPAERTGERSTGPTRGAVPRTLWMYWEGPMPGYIDLCCRTVRAHAARVELLDRAAFETLYRHDRDLPIDTLPLAQKADFIRAYLLVHHGGLYIDADCVVLGALDPVFDLADEAEFVGFRDSLGHMSNSFMASAPGGR